MIGLLVQPTMTYSPIPDGLQSRSPTYDDLPSIQPRMTCSPMDPTEDMPGTFIAVGNAYAVTLQAVNYWLAIVGWPCSSTIFEFYQELRISGSWIRDDEWRKPRAPCCPSYPERAQEKAARNGKQHDRVYTCHGTKKTEANRSGSVGEGKKGLRWASEGHVGY